MGKKILLLIMLLGCMPLTHAFLPRRVKIYNNTGKTLRFPNITVKTLIDASPKLKVVIPALLKGDREAREGPTIYDLEKAAKKTIEIPNGQKKLVSLAPGNDLKSHRLFFRKKAKDTHPLICGVVNIWELTIEIQKSDHYYKIRRRPARRRVPWRNLKPCMGQEDIIKKLQKKKRKS